MTGLREVLDGLARCLEYPLDDSSAVGRRTAELACDEPELSEALLAYAAWVDEVGVFDAEERYTQLFDMKPVCAMYVGYHVWGDTYPRGELLAGLVGELRTAGISIGDNLPDFLPTMLRLIGRQSEEDRGLLAHVVILPALRKMDEALAESPGVYPVLLRGLASLLTSEIPLTDEVLGLQRAQSGKLPVLQGVHP